jgi:hypothetical protein
MAIASRGPAQRSTNCVKQGWALLPGAQERLLMPPAVDVGVVTTDQDFAGMAVPTKGMRARILRPFQQARLAPARMAVLMSAEGIPERTRHEPGDGIDNDHARRVLPR